MKQKAIRTRDLQTPKHLSKLLDVNWSLPSSSSYRSELKDVSNSSTALTSCDSEIYSNSKPTVCLKILIQASTPEPSQAQVLLFGNEGEGGSQLLQLLFFPGHWSCSCQVTKASHPCRICGLFLPAWPPAPCTFWHVTTLYFQKLSYSLFNSSSNSQLFNTEALF